MIKGSGDRCDPDPKTGDDIDLIDRNRWEKATIAFTCLKAKIAATPILKHFDPDRPPVIVVYASKWAVSAALLQEHENTYWPVTFTSRTLKPNVINYGMVEKEVLALLRMLDVCYTVLVARNIKVLTRYSTLAWLVQSSGLNGRLGRWAALLSNWTLEIRKCEKGEEEILGTLAASITPVKELNDHSERCWIRVHPTTSHVCPFSRLQFRFEKVLVTSLSNLLMDNHSVSRVKQWFYRTLLTALKATTNFWCTR